MQHDSLPDLIVLYDDQCGLCHKFVRFLLKVDKKASIFFAPDTGKTATRLLARAERKITEADSVVVVRRKDDDLEFFCYSDAALQTFKFLGWPWKALWWFSIVPRFIRDSVYRMLARNRYSIFGKTSQCLRDSLPDESRMLE